MQKVGEPAFAVLEKANSRRAVLAALNDLQRSGKLQEAGAAVRVCAARARFKRHMCVLRASIALLNALPYWESGGERAVEALLAETRRHHPALGLPVVELKKRLQEHEPHFLWMFAELGITTTAADRGDPAEAAVPARLFHHTWPTVNGELALTGLRPENFLPTST
jgi:hypothetical protein